MAKTVLPVDFKDDILNVSMNGKRRYNLVPNSDGTYSLEDVSTYDQVGSSYGAGQINPLNQAVNESADAGKIIDDIETIGAVTEDGYIAGAKALQSVNDSLAGVSFVIDETTGKISGYTTEIGGADSVFPFNGMTDLLFFGIFYGSNYNTATQNMTAYGTCNHSGTTLTCTFTKDITVDLYAANGSRNGDATKTISHNEQTIYSSTSHSVLELIKENYKIVSGDVIKFNVVNPGTSTLQWLSSIMIIK